MKCWNSAFDAQRFESDYSSCMQAWKRSGLKERGDETQFTTKIGGKN